jgi:hypothetical protein
MLKTHKICFGLIVLSFIFGYTLASNADDFQGSFVTSSCDLTTEELIDACEALDNALPDLVITDITPYEGSGSYGFDVWVTNQGTGDMVSGEYTRFRSYLDGVEAGASGYSELNSTDAIGSVGGSEVYPIYLTGSGVEETLEICITTTDIAESDTSNNCYSILIETAGTPDLVITDITPYASSYGSEYFEVWVENQGDGDVPAGKYAEIQASLDGTSVGSTGFYIVSYSEGTAPVGETNSYVVQIPWFSGRTIGACITSLSITESDDTNNCFEKLVDSDGLEITGSPDLIVTDITTYVDTSYNHNFEIWIENQGDGDVLSSWYTDVQAYVDGVAVSSAFYIVSSGSDFGPAGGAGSFTVELTEGGTHDVEVCISDTGSVLESDYTNNCYTETIDIPAADLEVSAITEDGGEYTVTLSNTGENDLPVTTVDIVATIDEVEADSFHISSLDAGDDYEMTLDLNLSSLAGTHDLEVCVDISEVISESDEDNNCLGFSLEIPAADLSIDGISNTKDSAVQIIDISNLGTADIEDVGDIELTIYLEDRSTVYDTFDLSSSEFVFFLAGEADEFELNLEIERNTRIRACIDTAAVVEETDEENNCYETTLRPR